MIASQARLKSQLTEKGATLPSATIRTKQATGSTEVQQLPRLRESMLRAPTAWRFVATRRAQGG